jgi:hypothetical protein
LRPKTPTSSLLHEPDIIRLRRSRPGVPMGYHNVRDHTGAKHDWISAALGYEGTYKEKEQVDNPES